MSGLNVIFNKYAGVKSIYLYHPNARPDVLRAADMDLSSFYFFYFAFLITPDVGNYGICLYIGLYAIFSPYLAKLIYLTFNHLRYTT